MTLSTAIIDHLEVLYTGPVIQLMGNCRLSKIAIILLSHTAALIYSPHRRPLNTGIFVVYIHRMREWHKVLTAYCVAYFNAPKWPCRTLSRQGHTTLGQHLTIVGYCSTRTFLFVFFSFYTIGAVVLSRWPCHGKLKPRSIYGWVDLMGYLNIGLCLWDQTTSKPASAAHDHNLGVFLF